MKEYIIGEALRLSQSFEILTAHETLIRKLDMTLVGILKQEWPEKWPTFIPEVRCTRAVTSVVQAGLSYS